MAKDDGKSLKTACQMLSAELQAYAARNRNLWQTVACLRSKEKHSAERLTEVEAYASGGMLHPHGVIDLVRSCPSSSCKEDRMRYASLSCLGDGIHRSDACMASHLRNPCVRMLGTENCGHIRNTPRIKCMTCDLCFDRQDHTYIDVANGCCLRELECSCVFSVLGRFCYRRDSRVVKVLVN